MGYRLCFFVFLTLLAGCNKPGDNGVRRSGKDSGIPQTEDTTPATQPSVTYHYQPVNRKHIDTPAQGLNIILALNRIDLDHLRKKDTLVVPDSFFADMKVYSPFPWYLSALKPVRKLIFYDYKVEAFGAYENGTLVRWGPVSMGKASTPTPTGLFHTNWKSKKTVSTVDPDWIMKWYFNLENNMGVSMHEYELPGYPASHACVRLSEQDAIWFYDWCEQWVLNKKGRIDLYGTPVIIYGTYHFDRRKPWLALPENNKATTISETELEKEVERVLPLILERQAERDSVKLSL